jgi:hypothetical protein
VSRASSLRHLLQLAVHRPEDGLSGLHLNLGLINMCVMIFAYRLSLLISTRAPAQLTVRSQDIAAAELRVALPWYTYIYTIPFLPFYPLLAYAYYVKYDTWIKSEEWTFLACVTLGAGHALSFLITRWNAGAKSWVTTRKVCQTIWRS